MANPYNFALVPSSHKSSLFEAISAGCEHRATRTLGSACRVYDNMISSQAETLRHYVDSGIDGIALSVTDATSDSTLEAIEYAVDHGVPVVTFESDAPNSKRMTYVETDNFALGDQMGKVLLQIDPTGGHYWIISDQEGSSGLDREAGIRSRLHKSNWVELSHSSSAPNISVTSMGQVEDFMNTTLAPAAILSVGSWLTRSTDWISFVDSHPEVITIVADVLPHQMDLLHTGYISGIVGARPFQMGEQVFDALLALKRNESISSEIRMTSLQEVVVVPLELPLINVRTQHLGNLAYVGGATATVAVLLSVMCISWTYTNRNHRVVKASQPIFLIMIALGVLIMSLSVLPMSMDDGNFVELNGALGRTACMGQIWFFSIGFTTIFSALFSKTWRINRIFHNPNQFSKIVVLPKDVLAPFAVLLTANIGVLLFFTILSPLEFVRLDHEGTDAWNRPISSYGTCRSKSQAWPYIASLIVINTTALLFALVQAYVARSIRSEFSESQYIGIVMGSFVQTNIIALPTLTLVNDQPVVFYLLRVGVVFLLSVMVLLCIFLPKVSNVMNPEARTLSSVRISFPQSVEQPSSHTSDSSGLTLTRIVAQQIRSAE